MRTVPDKAVGSLGFYGYRYAASVWHTSDIYSQENSLMTVVPNRIYATPLFVGKSMFVDRIGIWIEAVASGGIRV